MFRRSLSSRDRVEKATKSSKKSFSSKQKLAEKLDSQCRLRGNPSFKGIVVTVAIGKDARLFAAHEDVLSNSPYLAAACSEAAFDGCSKRISIVDEEPETFSCVLEYLYKNDYSPRLLHDKRANLWYLESTQDNASHETGTQPVMYNARIGDLMLRDTAVYCAAERYGLDVLKRLALRKQSLQADVRVDIILRSAQYAYDNTPEHDTAIRAHYLRMIITRRKRLTRSGTMQQQMGLGGKIWFDLFRAMCDHIDDLHSVRGASSASSTPKTV